MGFDWENILGDTSYEDAVENAMESLEKMKEELAECEETPEDEMEKEKRLLAQADKTIDHGYSEELYYDAEYEEDLLEHVSVALYAGEGDWVEGEVSIFWEKGVISSSEGLPYSYGDSDTFQLNIKTGEILVKRYEEIFVVTAEEVLESHEELLSEALGKYNAKTAEELKGKLKIKVIDENNL